MEQNLEQIKDRYFLAGSIERFEEKMAVIIMSDGQKLLWPVINLPPDCEKGEKVRIILSSAGSDSQERDKIAKTILNQVLKNTNQKDAG
ncbi:MAG: hypothetical protein WC768_03825 [Patescibacteria group bacterium]|jgi:hypothetical protein